MNKAALILATLATLAVISAPAEARGWGHGWGPGIGLGIAAGALAAGAAGAYGPYGPYGYYDGGPYAYYDEPYGRPRLYYRHYRHHHYR